MAFSRVGSKIRRAVRRLTGREAKWIKHKRMVDPLFDAEHGVDTGGLTPIRDLRSAPPGNDGVDHIAVDPDHFAEAMAALDIDHRRYTFVDMGSGKGRALLLAAKLPFARLIGVEFADELAAVARSNFARLSLADPLMNRVEIVEADAARFELPLAPTVLFLYNPFGAATMTKVARNARASLDRDPRELFVLYVNSLHLSAWRASGFVEAARGRNFVLLKPS
jgi:SAM-dependent methyltransferase